MGWRWEWQKRRVVLVGLLVIGREPMPALEPGQQGVELVIEAANLGIPVPGRPWSILGPKAKGLAIADRVLGAEMAAAAAAAGQDLLQFATTKGTGAVGLVPIALARPLALVAGQVSGGKASAVGAGLGPKEGLQVIGQRDAVGVAYRAMAVGAGITGWRPVEVTAAGLDRGDRTPGAAGALARWPGFVLGHGVSPFSRVPCARGRESLPLQIMMVRL